MWTTVLLCLLVFIVVVADVEFSDKTVVRKCCQIKETLLKVTDADFNVIYKCGPVNDNFPFVIGKNNSLIVGFPDSCDSSELVETENVFYNEDHCLDRLTGEVYNDTEKPIAVRTIGLACGPLPKPISGINQLQFVRKCCPKNKVYDLQLHGCRAKEEIHDEKSLINSLVNYDNYVYVGDYGLACKIAEYALELSEDSFSFTLHGSSLTVTGENNRTTYHRGDWCVDREYSTGKMMARLCTEHCSDFKALCLRKCCPMGQHYVPRRAHTTAATCVDDTDEKQLLNISYYTNPLKDKNPLFKERIGLSFHIQCKNGKTIVHKERDEFYLEESGVFMNNVNGYFTGTTDFCFETYDNRTWGGDVSIETIMCFTNIDPDGSGKNFSISIITNLLSCVCLALTLIVYLSLPELRNLHGRTLICHVSVMLLAYGCLARVQYSLVTDHRICALYGYGIYFGFVSAFFWLNVMCFDIWWTFRSMRSVQPFQRAKAERRRFIWYSMYAWGFALLLTVTTLLFDLYPVSGILDANIGNGMCWFGSIQNSSTDWPHYIFFVIPMGLITFVNLVLWVLTSRHCSKVRSEVHRMQAGSAGDRAKMRFRADRIKYLLTVRMWVVMGVGWVNEFLSTIVSEPRWLWFTIDIINELQGVIIFIILVVKPKIFYLVKKKLGLQKAKTTNASSRATSSTFLSRTISNGDHTSALRTSVPADKVK